MISRPLFRYGSVSLLVFAVLHLIWWAFPVFFETWQLQVDDQLSLAAYQWQGPRPTSPDIVHIDLDNASTATLPLSQNDPRLYGEVIRILKGAGVRSILVDMIFPSCANEESCDSLAREVKAAANVHFPLILNTRKDRSEEAKPFNLPDRAIWPLTGAEALDLPAGPVVMINFPALNRASAGLGHINCNPDHDGVYRRVPLLLKTGDRLVPSIALRTLATFLKIKPEQVRIADNREIILAAASFPDGRTGDLAIPIDTNGSHRINFSGPWHDSFSHYSFSTIMELGATPEGMLQLTDELEDSLAIVSDISTGGRDFGPVPLTSYFPLSGLYSNLINSVLEQDYLTKPGPPANLAVNICLLFALALAAVLTKGFRLSLAALVLFGGLIGLWLYLFLEHRILLDIVKPTLLFSLTLPVLMLMQFLQIQQEKAKLTHYFAPSVMRKLLKDPRILDAVDKKELTILFSDIAGFTAWSSSRNADEIHQTLNRYFEEMADIVFANEGTIDKYMGDGLMVFFGDPVHYADHAQRAVNAARTMQERTRKLREEWEKDGGMPIVIRIGIHTGEVVVGNMGSRSRLDYTVIGSNVNLAQRLESNCPLGGVLISEQVYRQLTDTDDIKPAGTIRAKGFDKPITVYTIETAAR